MANSTAQKHARLKAAVALHEAHDEAEQAARVVREIHDVLDAGGWRHDELDRTVLSMELAIRHLKRAQNAMLFYEGDDDV